MCPSLVVTTAPHLALGHVLLAAISWVMVISTRSQLGRSCSHRVRSSPTVDSRSLAMATQPVQVRTTLMGAAPRHNAGHVRTDRDVCKEHALQGDLLLARGELNIRRHGLV